MTSLQLYILPKNCPYKVDLLEMVVSLGLCIARAKKKRKPPYKGGNHYPSLNPLIREVTITPTKLVSINHLKLKPNDNL